MRRGVTLRMSWADCTTWRLPPITGLGMVVAGELDAEPAACAAPDALDALDAAEDWADLKAPLPAPCAACGRAMAPGRVSRWASGATFSLADEPPADEADA